MKTSNQTLKKIVTIFVFMLSALTIKAQVFQEWVRTFNGPDSLFDRAVAIGADGCIYVTGSSFSLASRNDYVTIKYDKQGNQKWVAVFNGAANGSDIPTSIALDKQCNVVVTGFSQSSITGESGDVVTIKYDSTGVQQWLATYNGPNNSDDGGSALAVDASGNVYVTGTSNELGGLKDITIKYNAAGTQQWVTKGNDQGGIAIGLDDKGNVYIAAGTIKSPTQSSRTIFDDIVTAKYNAAGVQQWRVRFNGTDNNVDQANALTVDAQGNVTVTGFVNGFINADFATIRYNTNGVQQWMQQFNGALNGNDEAAAIVLDSKGNVTVTGKSSIAVGTPINDFTTIQYTKNGKLNWANAFNGPGNSDDFATAIAADGNDNIYITGASDGNVTGSDYATIKYAPNGTLQWLQRFNGAANGNDQPNDIAIDNEGNVYVTGVSQGASTRFDMATVKYGQGNFPPGYNGVTLNKKLDMLEFVNQAAFDTIINTLIRQDNEFTGDNGNTVHLLTLINDISFPAGKLKEIFINSSPLSDTVLTAVLTRNPSLPAGIVQDIFIANTSFTDKIVNAISASSLPRAVIKNIIDKNDNDFIIENPVLDNFERLLKFNSVRKTIEKSEEDFLAKGIDPEIKDADNFFIQDSYLRTVLNPALEIKIGKSIFKYLDTARMVEITSGSLNTLNRIRKNDNTVFISKDIIIHFLDILPVFCNSNFTMNSIGVSTIVFTNTSTGNQTKYLWDFGDGTTSTLINPTHTYPAITATYNVCLTITDNLGTCWSLKCKTVNIKNCTADFNFFILNNTTQVNFQNFSMGSATNYLWDFGDGATSTQFSPIHVYPNTSTSYVVCLTITNSTGCFSKLCATVSINSPPDCCDKNDRDRDNWNNYADNRKYKYTIWQTNVLFYHRWGAKTKNKRKTNIGIWVNQKAATIGAGNFGTVFARDAFGVDCNVAVSTNRSEQHHDRNSEEFNFPLGQVFWTRQGSLFSTHFVDFNGTRFSKNGVLFLSTNCP